MLNLLNLLHPFWIRSAGSSHSTTFSGCCVTHQCYPSLCFFPGRHSEFAQHPRGCAGCGVSSEGPGLEPAHQQCRHQLPRHPALPGLAGDAQRVCHQRGWATPGCQGMSGPFRFLLLGKMFPNGNKVTSMDLPCLPRGAQHFSPAQHPWCLVFLTWRACLPQAHCAGSLLSWGGERLNPSPSTSHSLHFCQECLSTYLSTVCDRALQDGCMLMERWCLCIRNFCRS